MAASSETSDNSYEERIARKKRVVNELLALRRMKYMQRKVDPLAYEARNPSPTTGRMYEAYRVIDDASNSTSRAIVSREQVRGLMKGTMLEKELTVMYGEKAVEDATDSYVRGSPQDGYRRQGHSFADVAQKRLFLHKLMKERKLKQEVRQQKRFDKEQELLQEKAKLRLAELKLREDLTDDKDSNMESDTSDENVNLLVNDVKQKIGGLEKHIKQLKQERRSNQDRKISSKIPQTIDYEFKPWQEEQVRIASEVVEDIIKRVLDLCVYTDDNLGSTLLEALLKTDNEAWERVNQEEMKHDAIVGIINELLAEVGSVIVKKVIDEIVFTAKMISAAACDLVINSAHTALYGKPPKENAGSKLVDKAWVEIAGNRLRTRRNIWAHSHGVMYKISPSTTSVVQQPQQVVEATEGEVTPISYDQAPLAGSEFSGEIWNSYLKSEFAFWESSDVDLQTNPLSLLYRKVIAISSLSASYDNRYLAVGTFHGDILVYDTKWQPFRPVRCVSFSGKTPERIIHIAWTLDRSRILSLSDSLCLIVWSVAYPSPASPSDSSHLGIPDDKDTSYACHQLTALAILEGKQSDFLIKEGPLTTSVPPASFSTPIIAKFSPIANMSASQNFVVVGFSSGEIMKCDLTLIIASRLSGLLDYYPTKTDAPHIIGQAGLSKGNKIANGIEIELFRSHHLPILMIHFVQNNGDMISIDQKMNVNVWKHNKDQFTSFNWYIPYQKMRFTGNEMIRVPKEPEKLIFEDEVALKKHKRGKKRRGKQIIEQERNEAKIELRTLRLQYRKPWHSDDQNVNDEDKKKKKDSKFVTKIYAPMQQDILDPAADQLFHVVTRQRSTNTLVRYATRVYSVSSQFCRALIGMEPSADGKKMFFMFLYEKNPPNVKAHITFVDLDLVRLDMLQSTVMKLFMTQSEFEEVTTKKKAAFTVTRKYMLLNSEYIFCTLAGRMHVLSMSTGSEVAWCAPDKSSKNAAPEDGVELPTKLGQIRGRLKLASLCPDGKSTHVFLQYQADDRKSDVAAQMFTMTVKPTVEERTSLDLLRKQLQESREASSFQEDYSLEQSVMHHRYTTRDMPPELYIQMILNSVVDNAVAMATKERMTNEQRAKQWTKDWQKMQGFFDGAA